MSAKELPTAPPTSIARAGLRAYQLALRAAERALPAEFALLLKIAAFSTTQLLHVAAKFRVADHLDAGPRTGAELAVLTGANEDALYRAMRALISEGVFAFDESGRFVNNRLSDTLRSGVIASMRDTADYFGSRSNVQAWADIDETMRTGEPGFNRVHGMSCWDWFSKHPDEGEVFAGAMTSLTEQSAKQISTGYNFGQHGVVCDIAGGRGTLLSEVLREHRSCRGMLFDAGYVLDLAAPYLRERGVFDRVDRVAGSFFESAPKGADLYMMKDILHDWDDERSLTILRNIRTAMRPGAHLLLAEFLVEDRTTLMPGPFIDVHMMMATDGGRQRSEHEFGALLTQTGFRPIKTHPCAAISLVEAMAV